MGEKEEKESYVIFVHFDRHCNVRRNKRGNLEGTMTLVDNEVS